MSLTVGRRVRITNTSDKWRGLTAVIVDQLTPDRVVVQVMAHGYSGRYAFASRDLVLLCPQTISGHNATYAFPCVRDDEHDGPCNRSYPSGGPCAECGCDSHEGQKCTSSQCGSAPCRAGLSWEQWREEFAREGRS